jgi:hypothetical protein
LVLRALVRILLVLIGGLTILLFVLAVVFLGVSLVHILVHVLVHFLTSCIVAKTVFPLRGMLCICQFHAGNEPLKIEYVQTHAFF